MNRMLKIAGREYIAYIRTIGFWLSMLALPLVGGGIGFISAQMATKSPIPQIVLVDQTGQGFDRAVAEALKPQGGRKRAEAVLVAAPTPLSGDAKAAGQALRPWLTGTRTLADGSKLNAAVIIHGQGEAIGIDFWTDNPAAGAGQATISRAVTDAMRASRLKAAGVDATTLAAVDALKPTSTDFSPKGAGKTTLRDRLPLIVGFGAAMLLWSMILTGAGILLNGVIEEKSSRILEVLLSSATTSEILCGKILGVAGVTGTVLGVWAVAGGAILTATAPSVGADLLAVMLDRGLVFYFAFYLVAGYLMYASIFTAVGAFCETTREAQTLLGPMMIVLSIPIVFLTQAIRNPDAPMLQLLSWIPPFTPFLMMARAPSAPPLWQVLGTGVLMVATVIVVVWIAGKAFRAGALSTGKIDLKGLIGKLRGQA